MAPEQKNEKSSHPSKNFMQAGHLIEFKYVFKVSELVLSEIQGIEEQF